MEMIMKMKSNLLVLPLLFSGLLIGCSSDQKSNSTISNSIKTPTVQTTNVTVSKNQTVTSDVNKPKLLGDWRVTMLPIEKTNIPIEKTKDFDFYKVDYKYQGDFDATNVKIKLGNAIITSEKYAKDEGGIVGSSFPSGLQHIEISITWTVQNQNFSQTLTFNTGQ
jgi:hypothetical protein